MGGMLILAVPSPVYQSPGAARRVFDCDANCVVQRRSLGKVGCLLEWAAHACAVPGCAMTTGELRQCSVTTRTGWKSPKKEFVRYSGGCA